MGAVPQIPTKIRFADFAPDAESIMPGVILGGGNLYPTAKGWRNYPSLSAITMTPLPKKALGAFTTMLGSVVVNVVGTEDQLYIYDGNNVPISQGLALTAISGRWRFDQYGGLVLATNGVDPVQAYNGTGTFAALGGTPPIASIVQASNYSLFLIEADSNTWWSSLSATLWTPSIATQTATDAIDETPGNITAAHRLRAGMAIYKDLALHFSQFAGPPFYWDFQLVSSQVGAPSQEAVANLGDIQYWPGPDDWYSFDGYALQRTPNNLKEWFFRELDPDNRQLIAARWDQQQNLVFWHFPSRAATPRGTLDSWICLNVRTGKWGCSRDNTFGPEAVDVPFFTGIGDRLTYAKLTTLHPTYAAFNGKKYGDFRARTSRTSGAIRASDGLLVLYAGAPSTLMLTTHDLGDYYNVFEVTRAKPRFSTYPLTGQVTVFNRDLPGGALAQGISQPLSADGFFNIRNSARLQRYRMVFTGDCEIVGFDVEAAYGGDR